MKVNFKQFGIYTDISQTEKKIHDVRKPLADLIYANAAGIAAHDLAFRIYKSDGEIEISDEDAALLLKMASMYTGVFYDSLSDVIGDKEYE